MVPRAQKIFQNSKIDEKLIFQKRAKMTFSFKFSNFFSKRLYMKNLFFKYFWPNTRYKRFKNKHESTKFVKGFRLVYELAYFDEKKFWSIFSIRWDPYHNKLKKKKIVQYCQFIHQSKALDKFSRFVLVFKFFITCIWSKIFEKQVFYVYFRIFE